MHPSPSLSDAQHDAHAEEHEERLIVKRLINSFIGAATGVSRDATLSRALQSLSIGSNNISLPCVKVALDLGDVSCFEGL